MGKSGIHPHAETGMQIETAAQTIHYKCVTRIQEDKESPEKIKKRGQPGSPSSSPYCLSLYWRARRLMPKARAASSRLVVT
jgi:hypothetical protein